MLARQTKKKSTERKRRDLFCGELVKPTIKGRKLWIKMILAELGITPELIYTYCHLNQSLYTIIINYLFDFPIARPSRHQFCTSCSCDRENCSFTIWCRTKGNFYNLCNYCVSKGFSYNYEELLCSAKYMKYRRDELLKKYTLCFTWLGIIDFQSFYILPRPINLQLNSQF